MKFQIAINMERITPDIDMRAVERHTLEMVQMADRGGFHIAWAAEHHALEMTIAPDPYQICTWWAAHTNRIRIGVADAGCVHQPVITGSGRKAARHRAFKAVNTVLANIKTAIAATFRAGASKHAPRRLAEFAYRFNRRYDLAAMIPRLAWVALRTPPMPYRMLKLAEDHG